MFFDHFVTVFLPHNDLTSLIFRFAGRLAAPIFCYFIAQGFYYTSNVKKYIVRLFVLAAISHIPYNLNYARSLSFFDATSVVWPLAMGLIALTAFKSDKLNIILKLAIAAACCILSYQANWNFFAVLWILGFGLNHGDFRRQILSFCIIGAAYLAWQLRRYGFFHELYPQWFQLGIFLAVPLLFMFNNKPVKKSVFMTWFFYIFYPAHLVFLYLLNHFTPLAEMIGRF